MEELCPSPITSTPIKNSNSQQLMYLFTLPDGGRRLPRAQWQLGRGWGRVQGAICLVLPLRAQQGSEGGPS